MSNKLECKINELLDTIHEEILKKHMTKEKTTLIVFARIAEDNDKEVPTIEYGISSNIEGRNMEVITETVEEFGMMSWRACYRRQQSLLSALRIAERIQKHIQIQTNGTLYIQDNVMNYSYYQMDTFENSINHYKENIEVLEKELIGHTISPVRDSDYQIINIREKLQIEKLEYEIISGFEGKFKNIIEEMNKTNILFE